MMDPWLVGLWPAHRQRRGEGGTATPAPPNAALLPSVVGGLLSTSPAPVPSPSPSSADEDDDDDDDPALLLVSARWYALSGKEAESKPLVAAAPPPSSGLAVTSPPLAASRSARQAGVIRLP